MLCLSGSVLVVQPAAGQDSPVRLSETYELANIILALTDYGKTDPWEVAQQSAYYREVRAYFDRHSNHPLLGRVNYSRQGWASYLSFRTDAYVFAFDSANHLIRRVDFKANSGFNPFEENLTFVEDFVKVTGFRQFYRDHFPYYQALARAYLRSQRYPEMLHFLETEFGKHPGVTAYAMVLSPLVGRMNCHRRVAGVETDFSTLPNFLLTGQTAQPASEEEVASGTHMLFTELDHGFVNPITEAHKALVGQKFNADQWDKASGYNTDSLSVFNEYMTWGVYDLFVEQYFPTVPEKVRTDWTLQNESRGFYASSLFTDELRHLYKAKKGKVPLKDLYPALLTRLSKIQGTLRQPTIVSCNLDKVEIADSAARFIVRFSEPMHELNSFDIVGATDQKGGVQQRHRLSKSANQIGWSANGTILTFNRILRSGFTNYTAFTVPWGRGTVINLKSRQGLNLPLTTVITTTVLKK